MSRQPSHEAALDALREQAAAYDRLLDLAGRQRAAVEGADEPALLSILRDRERVLAEAATLAERSRPLREAWPDVALSPADFAEGEALWKRVRASLDEITRRDRDDALQLQQRKLNVGKQLRQATAAKVANRRYMAAQQGGRMDRRS